MTTIIEKQLPPYFSVSSVLTFRVLVVTTRDWQRNHARNHWRRNRSPQAPWYRLTWDRIRGLPRARTASPKSGS